ncbi:helix-turn-helix transcriptional regulator [Sulfitobacter sp. 1A13421]|uniref:helix-turn-helix transcriptional regulator n=1 Tax=Sulfitobacter sp. 1A13421 TaxID=3368595 RepID=UPI0037454F39
MSASELKWATEQRFQLIEYQAFWLGSLNRIDLTSHFGISAPQASKDIAAYQSRYPRNIQYDHGEKRYVVTEEFAPRFMELKPDVFLNDLLREVDISQYPARLPTEVVPIPKRLIDPLVLQALTQCIAHSQSVEILYHSMSPSKPDAIWRRITPHSFVTDGLRWYTRAYCHLDQKFKDFLLSRCLKSREPDAPRASVHDDTYWNESFEVHLVPNLALSSAQKKVVAKDYGMTDMKLTVSTRKAMLYYFKKRLRLDVAHLMDEPVECPLNIENKAAFDAAIEEATK